MAHRIFLALLFSFITAGAADAQFGTIDQVIRAANEEKVPSYIRDLLDELSRKLQPFAREKGISLPTQMLAWSLTMHDIFTLIDIETWSLTLYAAMDALENQASEELIWEAVGGQQKGGFLDAAWGAIDKAHPKPVLTPAFDNAIQKAWCEKLEETWESAESAIVNAFKKEDSLKEVARKAYRIAEWAVLNHVAKNAETIIENIFSSTLRNLPPDTKTTDFVSLEAWREFRRIHFDQLSEGAMVFLAPWLQVLDSAIFIRYQARTSQLSLSKFVHTAFFAHFQAGFVFPREVILLIMRFAIDVSVPS